MGPHGPPRRGLGPGNTRPHLVQLPDVAEQLEPEAGEVLLHLPQLRDAGQHRPRPPRPAVHLANCLSFTFVCSKKRSVSGCVASPSSRSTLAVSPRLCPAPAPPTRCSVAAWKVSRDQTCSVT